MALAAEILDYNNRIQIEDVCNFKKFEQGGLNFL